MAVRVCMTAQGVLARPTSWGEAKEGRAVDLARRFCPDEAKVMEAMSAPGSATGYAWTPTPADLLGNWEVVTLEDLRLEALGK